MNNYLILLVPALLFGAVLIGYSFSNASRLLVLHLVLRGLIDSAYTITYQKIVGPFSIAQLYAVLYIVIFAAFLFLNQYRIKSELLAPLSGYIIIAFISTLFSQYWVGFSVFSLKWVYFYLLFLVVLQLGLTKSTQYIAVLMIICSAYPLLNQLGYSAISGPKCVPGQSLCSYIGSFSHESELASWILLFLVGASLGISSAPRSRMLLFYLIAFGVGLVALVLNNYRTAILGFAVYLAYIYLANLKKIDVLVSAFAFLLGFAGFILLVVYAYDSIEVYISDVLTFLSSPSQYIDLDGDIEKTTLFSGRLYLFNTIMFVFIGAGGLAYIFGIGPEVITEMSGTFAHNEFLSTIVELGFLGFCFLVWMLVAIWRIVKGSKNVVFPAMYLCILTTSLTTMPFHDTRGIILLAVIAGLPKGMGLTLQRRAKKQ